MANRLSPSHSVEIDLNNNTTPKKFLVIAIEAAKANNWNISYTSEGGFLAYTNTGFSSNGEEVKVTIDGDLAMIRSGCTGNQIVDWGKNKQNVHVFVETYNELKGRLSDEEVLQKYEELRPSLVSKEDDQLSRPTATTKETLESYKAIFTPVKGYYITPLLLMQIFLSIYL
jgi:rhomboid protease GluP